jgi:hypothetical protein
VQADDRRHQQAAPKQHATRTMQHATDSVRTADSSDTGMDGTVGLDSAELGWLHRTSSRDSSIGRTAKSVSAFRGTAAAAGSDHDGADGTPDGMAAAGSDHDGADGTPDGMRGCTDTGCPAACGCGCGCGCGCVKETMDGGASALLGG